MQERNGPGFAPLRSNQGVPVNCTRNGVEVVWGKDEEPCPEASGERSGRIPDPERPPLFPR